MKELTFEQLLIRLKPKVASVMRTVKTYVPQMCVKWKIVGSIRRCSLMPGDIDVLVIPKRSFSLDKMPYNKILVDGPQKKRIIFKGVQVDFVLTNAEEWGASELYFTGSAEFNIMMRSKAKKMRMRLNEHGLFLADKTCRASKYELWIFEALGMKYVQPYERGV